MNKIYPNTCLCRTTYSQCSLSGFTLIELLVVVLIIGILSAIALPQYTKAVERSRIAEARLILDSMYKAYRLCVLANGENAAECKGENADSNLFVNSGISLPGAVLSSGCSGNGVCVKTKDWEYSTSGSMLYATRLEGGSAVDSPYRLQTNGSDANRILYCMDDHQAYACSKLAPCVSKTEDGCRL